MQMTDEVCGICLQPFKNDDKVAVLTIDTGVVHGDYFESTFIEGPEVHFFHKEHFLSSVKPPLDQLLSSMQK